MINLFKKFLRVTLLITGFFVIVHCFSAPSHHPSQDHVEIPHDHSDPTAPVIRLAEIDKIVADKISNRLHTVKRDITSEAQISLNNFFEDCIAGIEPFADWALSYSAAINSAWNIVLNGFDHLSNIGRWIIGEKPIEVPNRNAELCQKKFQEMVLSEAKLKEKLLEVTQEAETILQTGTRELIEELNVDISYFLDRKINLKIPVKQIESCFYRTISQISYRTETGTNLLLKLVDFYVISAIADKAGSWVASYLVSSLGIKASTSIVPGALSLGASFIISYVINSEIEAYQKDKITKNLHESLIKFKDAVYFGTERNKGLKKVFEEAIDKHFSELAIEYKKAVKDLLVSHKVKVL